MNKRNLNIIKKDLLIITDPSILQIKDFSFQMIKAMRKCDFIFDITLGDSFSDIYSISGKLFETFDGI